MMAFECSNPLWGRTTNPYNSEYTCGGSSGGEGALLAMDGSVIVRSHSIYPLEQLITRMIKGMGSDVAGSLRIPSSYCGVFGFKPGAGRVPVGGAKGRISKNHIPSVTDTISVTFEGYEALKFVLGPMAR
jgi:Asp-tRNA(Asn)/Glu-tRNA(Gln) amidotransferase A subunit family amidase